MFFWGQREGKLVCDVLSRRRGRQASSSDFFREIQMSKGIRKQIRHVRRGEAFRRDHEGVHRHYVNAMGAGIRLTGAGLEMHF